MDNNDLIRRGDVLAQAYEFDDCNLETGEEMVSSAVYVDDVLRIPAVDAVEVVHGHWVTEEEALKSGDYGLKDTCSVCGHCDWDCTESKYFNYCPNCGARMDGRREEEHNAAD